MQTHPLSLVQKSIQNTLKKFIFSQHNDSWCLSNLQQTTCRIVPRLCPNLHFSLLSTRAANFKRKVSLFHHLFFYETNCLLMFTWASSLYSTFIDLSRFVVFMSRILKSFYVFLFKYYFPSPYFCMFFLILFRGNGTLFFSLRN